MTLSSEFLLTLQQLNGIGNKTIFKIVSQISFPIKTIDELCEFWTTLKGKKLQDISSEDIYEANKTARRIIAKAEEHDVGIISFYNPKYPDILRNCVSEDGKLDPPLILYYRGNLSVLHNPGVAVIGTREPTPNGVKAGEYFASEFARRGYNIVSGLAIGCDTSGHRGALNANGATTAFLANGLDWDSIYPKENLALAKEIVANGGLLLSEYAIGQNCGRYGLVARDRLQAGLAYATIVIQTGIEGGTMHAVNATIASHKPLFAVVFNSPQDISHEKVKGNRFLIEKEGAFPLRSKEIDDAFNIIANAQTQAQTPKQGFLLF